jgi:hypothetical protein
MYLVVLDTDGQTRFGRNLPAAPGPFRRAMHPFRDGLLVACECVHPWYWLGRHLPGKQIVLVLGHACAMKAVHGSKTKCDRQDAEATDRPGLWSGSRRIVGRVFRAEFRANPGSTGSTNLGTHADPRPQHEAIA